MSAQRRASSVHRLHSADEWKDDLLTYSGRLQMSVQK